MVVRRTGATPLPAELLTRAVERGLASPGQLRQGAAERGRQVAALVDGALRKVAA